MLKWDDGGNRVFIPENNKKIALAGHLFEPRIFPNNL